MGIKGVYEQIGNGRRVALAKLIDEKHGQSGRSLRIAIDVSIWLYQIQASQGGVNPGLRTLYFRLVRLLRYRIQPLFVFDGPNRPPMKRNNQIKSNGFPMAEKAKRLISLFGFLHHSAPGEAEAECALLQKQGIVDIVLSEDVDTLAFGCTLSIRNWSANGTRTNKTPTHVSVLDVEEIKRGKSQLDREGMILIAMMSGGDYCTEGIPGCGIKLACEAAKAGFGTDLCEISLDNETGLQQWKDRLAHELATNESGFFSRRHKKLAIPKEFPDSDVLRWHAYPVTSDADALHEIEVAMNTQSNIDIRGLRDFVDEEFDWKHLSGAKKFLRQFAPSLLAHKLRELEYYHKDQHSLEEQTERESRLIDNILDRREGFDTDGIPEIRVSFKPALVVDLDLDREEQGDDEATVSSSSEDGGENAQEKPIDAATTATHQKSALKSWDPEALDKAWLLESDVERGAPLSLERWRASLQHLNTAGRKKSRDLASKYGGMKRGAIESYLTTMKPHAAPTLDKDLRTFEFNSQPGSQSARGTLSPQKQKQSKARARSKTGTDAGSMPKRSFGTKNTRVKQSRTVDAISGGRNQNPWTLAQRSGGQVDTACNLLSPFAIASVELEDERAHPNRAEHPAISSERWSSAGDLIDLTED